MSFLCILVGCLSDIAKSFLTSCMPEWLLFFLSVGFSVCLFVYAFILLSIHLSVCLSIHSFFCLFAWLCMSILSSFCLSIYSFFCLSIYSSFCPAVCLSACLFVRPVCSSVCLSVFIFICLSILYVVCLYCVVWLDLIFVLVETSAVLNNRVLCRWFHPTLNRVEAEGILKSEVMVTVISVVWI